MHRLIRRLLGMGPSPSEVHRAAGRVVTDLFVLGLQDPRPLTAKEMDRLMAYTGGVARRSFSALYEDEDGQLYRRRFRLALCSASGGHSPLGAWTGPVHVR
ncbi:hypothetical protein ABZT17_35025 [Streptomyces sp. NPDC005648]|uniref:hypothetical protein n=1 Tax=Streptomyces sp. NPDC005648 TaxID=3157044 RepID=UPI0033AEF0CF